MQQHTFISQLKIQYLNGLLQADAVFYLGVISEAVSTQLVLFSVQVQYVLY